MCVENKPVGFLWCKPRMFPLESDAFDKNPLLQAKNVSMSVSKRKNPPKSPQNKYLHFNQKKHVSNSNKKRTNYQVPTEHVDISKMLRLFQNSNSTPPKFNIAPENRESQKETHLPTIHFQGHVKLPGGTFLTSSYF